MSSYQNTTYQYTSQSTPQYVPPSEASAAVYNTVMTGNIGVSHVDGNTQNIHVEEEHGNNENNENIVDQAVHTVTSTASSLWDNASSAVKNVTGFNDNDGTHNNNSSNGNQVKSETTYTTFSPTNMQ